jgi:membrane protein DedA with SNARE-associated domain
MGWVRFPFCTVVGSVIWATVIGLGAYYLGDSLHRPTGPLAIALAVLVLCLVVTCLVLLLRTMRRFEDEAERCFPVHLIRMPGKTKQDLDQDHENAAC